MLISLAVVTFLLAKAEAQTDERDFADGYCSLSAISWIDGVTAGSPRAIGRIYLYDCTKRIFPAGRSGDGVW